MNPRYLLTTAAIAGLMLAGTSVALATSGDKDCDDFPTQAAAQAFFVANGPGDRHRLDRDKDGQACENHEYVPAKPAEDPKPKPKPQVDTVPNTEQGVETGGL